jgi:hypothetical protein
MDYTFSINKNNDIDSKSGKIIDKYWELEGESFKHKPTEIKNEFNISQYTLNNLIRDNSECIINRGICVECGERLEDKVTSHAQFKRIIESKGIHCSECKSVIEKRQNIEREQARISIRRQNMQTALDKRLWEKISTKEFEVLKEIIRTKNRDAIFRDIFKNDYYGTWEIVNKLERIGLLNVIRGEDTVTGFEFLDGLEDQVLDYNEKISRLNEESTLINTLGFSLPKKLNKTKITQPDFSGIFVLPTDVLLKQGVEYLAGGWIQSDGSINLKFTPKDEVFPTESKSVDNEPQHIKNILSKMYNSLEGTEKIEDENDESGFLEEVPF